MSMNINKITVTVAFLFNTLLMHKTLQSCFCFFRMGREIKVTINKPVHCMLGSKRRTVIVRPTAVNGGATFKKEGNDIALMWPES